MRKLKAWLGESSNITALATFVGTAAALVAHYATHDATLTATAGGMAFGAVHALVPQNTAGAGSVEKLVEDVVTATVNHRLAQSVPLLAADALAAVQALTATPAPAAPQAVAASVVVSAPPAA